MKVYEVIMHWAFDGDENVETHIFSTKEKAQEYFNKLVKDEKETSWLRDYFVNGTPNDLDFYADDSDSFYASLWSDKTFIDIWEKEVDENE